MLPAMRFENCKARGGFTAPRALGYFINSAAAHDLAIFGRLAEFFVKLCLNPDYERCYLFERGL